MTWIHLEIATVLKSKDKYHDITYMWNLKNDTNDLIYKIEIVTDVENKLMVSKGEWDKLGYWN